jgi:hypothetical protein
MAHVNDIDRAQTREIVMLYQIDKPIAAGKIGHALEHNQAIIERRGERYAQGCGDQDQRYLDHHLRDQDLPNLKTLEMTIEEKKPKFAEFPSVTKFFRQGKEIGDGIRVSREEGGRRRDVSGSGHDGGDDTALCADRESC